jgi:hypothetical protein
VEAWRLEPAVQRPAAAAHRIERGQVERERDQREARVGARNAEMRHAFDRAARSDGDRSMLLRVGRFDSERAVSRGRKSAEPADVERRPANAGIGKPVH